jgi:hypothetical protein
MSHSSHSSAPPAQGNAGAQQAEAPASPTSSNAASQHVHQHSVQQPAAPGETDNIQPEVEAIEDSSSPDEGESGDEPSSAVTSIAAVVDDLERGIPGAVGTASTNNNAAGSDNTMNEEGGAQGAGPSGGNPQPDDADMEFVAGSTLPPIDDARRQHKDKAEQKAIKEAQECL